MGKHFHYVVLDTNALIDTRALRSPALQQVLEAREANAVRLVVPEVVRIEFREHLRRELRTLTDAVSKATKRISGLVDEFPVGKAVEVDALTSRGMAQFEMRCRQKSIEFLPIPKAALVDVVERVASRRPPVDGEGRGLGDTLIWLSTLEVLDRPDAHRVTLVTADGDFVSTSALKGALLAEAAARGAGTRLKHVRDIRSLPSALHFPKLELSKLDWIRRDSSALSLTVEELRKRMGLTSGITIKELEILSGFKGSEFGVAVASGTVIAESISWSSDLFGGSIFGSLFDSSHTVSRERVSFQVLLTVAPDGSGPVHAVEVWSIQQRAPVSFAETEQFAREAAIDPPLETSG